MDIKEASYQPGLLSHYVTLRGLALVGDVPWVLSQADVLQPALPQAMHQKQTTPPRFFRHVQLLTTDVKPVMMVPRATMNGNQLVLSQNTWGHLSCS